MTEAQFEQEYELGKKEAREWKKDYPEFERLANNELPEDLDENDPEVSDGSLAAALYKWPKRVVPKDLSGSPRALDRTDEWINEFAKIEWEKNIIPNANTQAPFTRKWKDAVRKAGIYGSVPLITIVHETNNGTASDFIVAYPQDVVMEPGKISDNDSDVFYWDVYFTDDQLRQIIKDYDAEIKAAKEEERAPYNTWNRAAVKELLDSKYEEDRDTRDMAKALNDKPVKKGGKKVVMAFRRGVGAMFTGYAPGIKKFVREFENPDPTGDPGVHYLYCYQDFVNPYGVGIAKLAGGKQNVLDFFTRAHVLATQVGIQPPVEFKGDTAATDFNSYVYGQNAIWIAGAAQTERKDLANGVYQELPASMSMYKSSMNQLIPMGDISISGSDSGDPNVSKTPAGVKFQQQNLSIDDEDMTDNLLLTYSAVGRSMINVHFANKQGSDIMNLTDSERERIFKTAPGLFPQFSEQQDPESGEVYPPSNELEVIWDNARAHFDFTVDAEPDKTADEDKRLEGAMKVLELVNADPAFTQEIQLAGKKFNKGELLSDIIGMLTDNDKIITDISPEEQSQMEAEAAQQEAQMQIQGQPQEQLGQPQQPQIEPGQRIQEVMNQYGVDEETAAMALDAEYKGLGDVATIMQAMQEATA